MPLPKNHPPKHQLARLVLIQEMRGLLVTPALWIMLIIVSLLVGYSFFQAVDLFSQASRTALSFPEMTSGMNPLKGIFVPTFGAYYLSQTLLLPFVAIRLIGLDKQSGALKLLLQLPLSPLSLCGSVNRAVNQRKSGTDHVFSEGNPTYLIGVCPRFTPIHP